MMPDRGGKAEQRSVPGTGVVGAGRRAAFVLLGFVFLALGIIGALLPVMPTTVFLILAAWSFGRSSPRLENWMLDNPRFGPSLRAWRESGAVSRKAKWMACGGMAIGFVVFWFTSEPPPWLAVVVGLGMLACAGWLVTRPEPIPEKPGASSQTGPGRG